jgi:hypothetical protein
VATNAAGTATAVTTHSAVVIGSPVARKAPGLSGRANVGRKLSASSGRWSDTPTGYRFQWLRCNARGTSCVRIKGATHPKYRLTQRDVRHRLRVRVIASNIAGRGIATSRPTAYVSH